MYFIKYLIVLLVILISGSFYFGMLGWKIKIIILLLCLFTFYKEKRTMSYKSVIRFIIISLFLFISSFNEIAMYKQIIILMFIGFLMCNIFSKNEFIKILINEVLVISLISLICFLLLNLRLITLTELPLSKSLSYVVTKYIITPYYTAGIMIEGSNFYDFTRNSGVWWEPGAWQAIVNVCLMFLVNNNNLFTKKQAELRVVVFIATIITTQSSTGYIVLLLIILANIKIIMVSLRRIIMFFVMIIVIFSYIPVNKVINDKVVNKSGSYNTRINDVISTYKIWTEKPILGFGFGSEEYKQKEKEHRIFANSNGLGLLFANTGIMFSLFYIYCQIEELYYMNNKKTMISLILVIMVIIHSTEYFIFTPIFITLLFPYRGDGFNGINEVNVYSKKTILE